MRTLMVYQVIDSTEARCDLGHKHTVWVYAAKRITETDEYREHDNGYEKRMTALFTDAQGRVYHERIEIDYTDNVWYLRDDGAHYARSPVRRPAVDLSGRIIG